MQVSSLLWVCFKLEDNIFIKLCYKGLTGPANFIVFIIIGLLCCRLSQAEIKCCHKFLHSYRCGCQLLYLCIRKTDLKRVITGLLTAHTCATVHTGVCMTLPNSAHKAMLPGLSLYRKIEQLLTLWQANRFFLCCCWSWLFYCIHTLDFVWLSECLFSDSDEETQMF